MTVFEESLMDQIEKTSVPEYIINAARHLNQTYSSFSPDAALWKEVKAAFGPYHAQLFDEYSEKIIAIGALSTIFLFNKAVGR